MSNTSASLTTLPEGYGDWVAYRKGRFHRAQQRSTLGVKRELVLFYWQICNDILTRQAKRGWWSR